MTSVLPAALESDAWVRLSSAAHSLKGPLTHGRTATWRVRARVCVKCRSELCRAAAASCLLWARLSRPHQLGLNFTSASMCVFVSAVLSAPHQPPLRSHLLFEGRVCQEQKGVVWGEVRCLPKPNQHHVTTFQKHPEHNNTSDGA